MGFWMIVIIPTQGFFNALIYFHSMTQPRAVEQTHSSSAFAPPYRQWESFRFLFSRRSALSAIAAVVARVIQAEELQDSEEEDPVGDEIDRRNGAATAGSRIPSTPVGMGLSIPSEANLDH
jgi:hypothetical protein